MGIVFGSTSAYQPNVGRQVATSFAERTYRRILRPDGSVAADERRETLTLNHVGQARYGIGDRAALRAAVSGRGRGFWGTLADLFWSMLGIIILVGGTRLAWEIGAETIGGVLFPAALVLSFWIYFAYLANKS